MGLEVFLLSLLHASRELFACVSDVREWLVWRDIISWFVRSYPFCPSDTICAQSCSSFPRLSSSHLLSDWVHFLIHRVLLNLHRWTDAQRDLSKPVLVFKPILPSLSISLFSYSDVLLHSRPPLSMFEVSTTSGCARHLHRLFPYLNRTLTHLQVKTTVA